MTRSSEQGERALETRPSRVAKALCRAPESGRMRHVVASRTRGSMAAWATSPISVPSITAMRQHQQASLDDRIVALTERPDQQAAEARAAENELDGDGAAEDPADAQGQDGDDRQQRVRQAHGGTGCVGRDSPLACSKRDEILSAPISIIATRVTRATSAMPPRPIGERPAGPAPPARGRRKPETSQAAPRKQDHQQARARSSEPSSRAG